jgi:serine O-acetyltransferase
VLSSAVLVKPSDPSKSWYARLPGVLSRAAEDVRAVCANDPAARSAAEVLLLYPGLHALWLHRAAHSLWSREYPFAARLVSYLNRFATGIDIHPGAEIGRRVVIDHGMGVVIGETAKVGDDCLLYKGIVLGGTTLSHGKRHPQLGNHVVVGSNACVLGCIEIGDGARIGSGSVVIKPVPTNATVVGVPARVIVPSSARFDAALDHANLPDPVLDMIRALAHQNRGLRHRITQLERKVGVVADDHGSEELLPFDGDDLPPLHGG